MFRFCQVYCNIYGLYSASVRFRVTSRDGIQLSVGIRVISMDGVQLLPGIE